METDIKTRNKQIKNGAKGAFIFVVMTMGVSQILNVILPSVPSRICEIFGMLLGTLTVLTGSCKPEKGTLPADKNKMTGTGFVVLLGAFMLAKLLSLLPSAALLKLFVNEENADALQGIASLEDNLFLSFLFLGVATPFCEEAVFRGCIGNCYRKYGVWFAMIMSSLLFALYHCNLFQLVSAFLPGIVLFYVAMNYSLKWSILFHFINNGVLSIGKSALQKVSPDSFLTNYGEYVIEAALIIAAICLMKKDNALEKVKAFLSAPKNEKGAYKAAMGNIWFILIVLAMAVVSGMMLFMLSGNMPEIPAVG